MTEDCEMGSGEHADTAKKKKKPPFSAVQVGNSPEYTLGESLGCGGQGEVYRGKSPGAKDMAVKLERVDKYPEGKAPDEWQAYEDLSGIHQIPHVHHKGQQDGYYVTIMDLLGPSLRDIRDHEIVVLGPSLRDLRENETGSYVHGDIKPHNLLLGRPNTPEEKELFLVDFGLATRWKDSTGKHVEYDQQADKFRGTKEYASVHTHLGRTKSRRDDLESLAYTLISLRAPLPWQEHEGENKSHAEDKEHSHGEKKESSHEKKRKNIHEERKKQRYFVCKKMMSTPSEKLCCSLPQPFKEFFEYVVKLKFDEPPDYARCISLFKGMGCPQRSTPKQPIQVRTGRAHYTQWISVYEARKPMKQRYHYGVNTENLVHFIEKEKEENLLIRSVASCKDLWTLIFDADTGFSDQIYKCFDSFLDKEWIKERWDNDYRITAIAGRDDGKSLVVMSKGSPYKKQEYKVEDSFPFGWIRDMWKANLYISSMATAGSKWAAVMSQSDSTFEQAVELDFAYPLEGIHQRWDNGFQMTAIAATHDQLHLFLPNQRCPHHLSC